MCVIFLECTAFGSNFNMAHPEIEYLSERLTIGPCNQFIHQLKPWQTEVSQTEWVINSCNNVSWNTFVYFKEIIDEVKLIPKNAALFNIHLKYELAKKPNLDIFEELFFIQLQLITKNLVQSKQNKKGHPLLLLIVQCGPNVRPLTCSKVQKTDRNSGQTDWRRWCTGDGIGIPFSTW
jgi:ATP-dependent DNA helicase RecG